MFEALAFVHKTHHGNKMFIHFKGVTCVSRFLHFLGCLLIRFLESSADLLAILGVPAMPQLCYQSELGGQGERGNLSPKP